MSIADAQARRLVESLLQRLVEVSRGEEIPFERTNDIVTLLNGDIDLEDEHTGQRFRAFIYVVLSEDSAAVAGMQSRLPGVASS